MARADVTVHKIDKSLSGSKVSKVLTRSIDKEKRQLQMAAEVSAKKQEILKSASSSPSSSGKSGSGKDSQPGKKHS